MTWMDNVEGRCGFCVGWKPGQPEPKQAKNSGVGQCPCCFQYASVLYEGPCTATHEGSKRCSFTKAGNYAGDMVCPTDNLEPMTLTVVATGEEVDLLLCAAHRNKLSLGIAV